MKKNIKGSTIVELVVSISMLFVIVTFLFQIIISLKEVYNSSGIKTEMLNKQVVISKMINDDLKHHKLEMALKCNNLNTCLALYFEDGSYKTLELIPKTDETPAYLIYGDYKAELVSGSNFGSYSITSETIAEATGVNNSIMNINIPITHPLLREENYGINIIYQYNSNTTSITDIAMNGNTGVEGIYLAGASTMVWYTTVPFEDPGYFYLDENKNLVKASTTNDKVLVEIGSINGNNEQIIRYSSKENPSIYAERTVKYINTSYDYTVNSSYYSFNVPVSGTYKIEAWGANGGSTALGSGGIGAYTSGEIRLLANEKLYIYVGGAPSGDNGGYNGGGSITAYQSSNGGAAGGGATDIRLESGAWNLESGLRSRIMVAAGGGAAKTANCGSTVSVGGHGGTFTSTSAIFSMSCNTALWNIATGATQTAGGAIDVYSGNSKTATYQAGVFGYASAATSYSGDIISGGGGGYYGGASAGYGSFATGGSSFVSGDPSCTAVTSNGAVSNSSIHYSGKSFNNTNMISGNSISGNANITKPVNTDDGYARIKLISISYGNGGEEINNS